jgi:hypothetical protein
MRCGSVILIRAALFPDPLVSVLVHLGISAREDFLADRRPTSHETEIPYFRPFPVADESCVVRIYSIA